jgi:putative peptide zinc metalloprotease protein
MAESLFSPSWYRVANLKPRMRSQSEIHRHVYRGELWYVLQDHATGRHFRFSPVSYGIIGLMNGERTIHALWEEANRLFGDEAPTQGEMIRLLGQLHASDVLLCDVPPDTVELLRRSERIEKTKLLAKLRSPLFLKFPLWDPEVFLNRTYGYLRPLFSRWAFLFWLALVAWGIVTAGLHWAELTNNVTDRVFSAQSLLVLWLVYPLVKVLHEFSHGYAIKHLGGEVHEMGVMLLVLMPIPYVEASAATSLRNKWERVLTGGAGIMAEMLVAALALQAWVVLEPGLLRSVAFNIILVGSVSTVLFNGNPLLRYDGYYMLMDWLEIPNLAQRSQRYLGYLTKRHLLGMDRLEPIYMAPGERGWLFFYSIAAFIYRLFVYTAIILFIAGKFFIVGIALAIWAALNMLAWPLLKKMHFLLFSPALREHRGRAVGVAVGGVALALLLLFMLPFPSWTNAEGVVWVGEESLVRAGMYGFIEEVMARPGELVNKGDVLLVCSNPELLAEREVYLARLDELRTKYAMALIKDRVQVNILLEEIGHVEATLSRLKEMVDLLLVRSAKDGVFVLPGAEDLQGRFVPRGGLLGYVLADEAPLVRTVVAQDDMDDVRQRTRYVRIRFADRLAEVLNGVIRREVPGATGKLPSTILGFGGGGEIAVDPSDDSGVQAFETTFQFELEVTTGESNEFIGNRAYVRFEHEPEPLGWQIVRKIRQLLLKRFNV